MVALGPVPKAQFFDINGDPLVGGKVYVYTAGTTTPLDTYTDASGTVANSNPVILDARGEAAIWFGSTAYKIVLKDANDTLIYTVDYIQPSTSNIVDATIFNATITNSTINSTPIGASSPSSGAFTTITGDLTGTFSGDWDAIPAGTSMLFAQTSAPIGWVKSATHNDKALRVVSGSAGSGGSVAFTTAFASQAVTGTVASHVLDISEIPSHTHNYANVTSPGTGLASGTALGLTATASGAAGGGLGHSHGFTGTAINLAVQYVDVIIAVKS